MFRFLFPSFEKPVDRPRYLNIEQESRNFNGVGIVLLLAAGCGVGLALWEPSHQITTPFTAASSSASASPPANVVAKASETTAVAAEAEDEPAAPTVKLSTQCSQRATARRDCASAKAFKDARLKAPDPAPAAAEESKPALTATKASVPTEPAQPLSVAATETTAALPSETPAAQTQKPAAAPKAKRAPRPAEEAPVERLVKVYDQVMPDGRRVPVYRRAGTGALETGSIVDGEYRPAARRANLDPPSGHYFGLQ